MGKADTRQGIIDASIELFASNGFEGTSIRDISRAAKTTIPNIYYYFGNKKDLYSYVLKDVMTRFAQAVFSAARGDSIRDQLANMGKAKHHFIAQNPHIMRLFFREQIGGGGGFEMIKEMGPILSNSVAMMAEMVSRGIASGEFRQVDPQLTTRFLLGVFNTYDMEAVSLGRVPSDEEIEAVVDLALEAIKKR